MAVGPKILRESIVSDDSSRPITVIVNDTTGHMAIDYSGYYARIADAAETVANKVTAMEAHQQKLLELAEGNGIHILSPLDYLSFISTYRFMVEGKELLKDVPELSDKELDKANKRIADYLRKINTLPKAF
jgi:hypothetical protein